MEKNVSLHKCYGYPIVNPRYLLTDSFSLINERKRKLIMEFAYIVPVNNTPMQV